MNATEPMMSHKISYSQIASKEPEPRRSVSPPMYGSRSSVVTPPNTFNNIPKPNPNETPVVKPSLDDVKVSYSSGAAVFMTYLQGYIYICKML